MSIISELIGGHGAKREAKRANRAEEARVSGALGELTPEAIQGLIDMFFGKFYAQLNPQMQGAQQRLAANAGRRGLSHAGLTTQLSAGIPGQFANMAQGQAIGAAVPVAGQRASVRAGKQFTNPPSWLSSLGTGLRQDEQDIQAIFNNFLSSMGGGGGGGGGMMKMFGMGG